MATDALRFSTTNFLGIFDDRWTVVNGSISGGVLQLNANGKATLLLTTGINSEFKYYKLTNIFWSEALTSINNYKSKPTVFIQEVYKNSSNQPDRVKVRSLGFNTILKSGDTEYTDETILTTLDRKLSHYKIEIQNETDSLLTIFSLTAFQSVDISETQVNSIVNEISKAGSAEQIKAYRNADGSINGLGVFLQGSTDEVKFRPSYFNGQLIAIETNYGQTISIQNIVEQINLLNSNTP